MGKEIDIRYRYRYIHRERERQMSVLIWHLWVIPQLISQFDKNLRGLRVKNSGISHKTMGPRFFSGWWAPARYGNWDAANNHHWNPNKRGCIPRYQPHKLDKAFGQSEYTTGGAKVVLAIGICQLKVPLEPSTRVHVSSACTTPSLCLLMGFLRKKSMPMFDE